jgi:hypothetical protein
VLVTGIQPAQVLGLKGLLRAADASLLDPCDIPRVKPEDRDEEQVRAAPIQISDGL